MEPVESGINPVDSNINVDRANVQKQKKKSYLSFLNHESSPTADVKSYKAIKNSINEHLDFVERNIDNLDEKAIDAFINRISFWRQQLKTEFLTKGKFSEIDNVKARENKLYSRLDALEALVLEKKNGFIQAKQDELRKARKLTSANFEIPNRGYRQNFKVDLGNVLSAEDKEFNKRGGTGTREEFRFVKVKEQLKSDFFTTRCPITISYKNELGQVQNITGAELHEEMFPNGTGSPTPEQVFEKCKELGGKIFGSGFQQAKYQHILDQYPKTDDENVMKGYVVAHMLSLATQNSLNTLNTNALANAGTGREAPVQISGKENFKGVVDFEENVVHFSLGIERVSQGQSFSDVSGVVSLKYHTLEPDLIPETKISITTEQFNEEQLKKAFSKPS